MANRWPPWIESVILAGAFVDVTSSVYTTLLSIDITPKIDTRARIAASVEAEIVVGAGAYLLRLGGGATGLQATPTIPAGVPTRITPLEVVDDLAAGIPTTWVLQAAVGTPGDTLRVFGPSGCTWIHVTALPGDGIAF